MGWDIVSWEFVLGQVFKSYLPENRGRAWSWERKAEKGGGSLLQRPHLESQWSIHEGDIEPGDVPTTWKPGHLMRVKTPRGSAGSNLLNWLKHTGNRVSHGPSSDQYKHTLGDFWYTQSSRVNIRHKPPGKSGPLCLVEARLGSTSS